VPVRDRARQRVAARRWLVGAFTERLLYKGAALFLALVLWLVVNAEEPIEDTVPVRLVVEHDSSLVIASPLPTIRALVVGRARDVTRLYADPLEVRRSIPPDAGDSVRFELTRVDVLPPSNMDGDVLVRRVEPSVITMRLTTRVQRRVPVRPRARVSPDSGWRQVGATQAAPDSVTVVGPRVEVEAVSAVPTATVELHLRDTLGTDVALDTTGLGVQVQPARVRLRVPAVRDTFYTLRAVVPFGPAPPPRRP
jgi:YbbR domain-containing protein